MINNLSLTLQPDSDGTGELFAKVSANGFSGTGSAWFDCLQLAHFAEELAAAYPLPANKKMQLEGGYWSKSEPLIEQLHLGLSFYPIGSTGKVGCQVSLATPCGPDQARPESQATVRVELITSYEQVRVFANALEMLAKGTANEAMLTE